MKKFACLLVVPILLGFVACSSDSGTTSPFPPDKLAQPATITVTTLDEATVDISWSAVTEPTFVGYMTFLDYDVVDTVLVTNYQYTDLDPGTFYTFSVQTLGDTGYRSYHTFKTQGTAVSAAPEELVGEILSASSVRLTWESSGEATVSHYRLYKNDVVFATVVWDSLGHTDSGLAAGTYIYKVATLDTLGFVSAASDTVEIILP